MKENKHSLLRLSKLMTERGLCSRREADQLIEKGWVQVDGVTQSQLGIKVNSNCEITILKPGQNFLDKKITLILNKPLGWVSGQPEQGYKSAIELINEKTQDSHFKGPKWRPSFLKGLAPVGRLDINSTGLLIYSQDGLLAKKIIGPQSQVEKEYLVRVKGSLSAENLKLLNHGLKIDGKTLKPAQVKWLNSDQLQFVLKEGKKRQIRKMCEQVGLQVLALKRVRVGPLKLGRLPLGHWRYLNHQELSQLSQL